MFTTRRWAHSLRFRLLAATLVALVLALVLAGVLLASLFREHVMRQFETVLTQQLDQLTARLEFDAAGQPLIDATRLSDPRWQKPYSGLYWQLDRIDADNAGQSAALRSRSLWDAALTLPRDALANGAVHVHEGRGPNDAPLMMVERTVHTAEQPEAWRLIVAGDMQEATGAVARFTGVLAASLLALGVLLVLAALAQVAVGLAPLHAMHRALAQVQEGRSPRLQGRFPTEVQPLIDGFNGVLDRNAEVVARARTQAGNLAHALKTPLAVLAQAADSDGPRDELALRVREQVALSRRHIDWHLARARVAATQRLPGQRTPLAPVLSGLIRVMDRVHAERQLDLHLVELAPNLAFAGEEQDLQEMMGNLLDNACLWARQRVEVLARRDGDRVRITVEDDGPGIAPEQRDAVLARGVRLDEATPGSGLGLAIVADLVALYQGNIALDTAALGGLRVSISLPASP
ncbi:sensor histidine kinase [Hydrogenophaga sp. A37]|uniref:sensor histidine kinase n=1 Tax=Hydrogenophaga sp. A37 TaxID=1945864 RepID=UPI0009845080|nr:ATP-binding protein [Hydrogenophaga sp. A37]OOG81455.1 ATP-binding protein [Hydrogenophaga sp. A37]